MDKEQAEKILAVDERARSNDIWYLLMAWRAEGVRIYVNYEDLMKMTEPEKLLALKKEILGKGIKKEPAKKAEKQVKEKPIGSRIEDELP